jgi:hypothetical protein
MIVNNSTLLSLKHYDNWLIQNVDHANALPTNTITVTVMLVESPPVLANGGVENEARGGRGPRSAQRTKLRVAVSNLLY